MIRNILLVSVGGGLGSALRYLCQKWIYQWYPHTFPWGTFLVNVTGCFLIGIFFAASEKSSFLTAEWRLFLTTGLCGGFTTFSAFAFENMSLIKNGEITYALLYTVSSVILGIVAVFAGVALLKFL
ncbi:MAG: fluoride efflux transporter CrcB [Bacteroidota bacterium]